MTFVALETGLKFDEFSRCFWGHPRSWQPAWLVVNWLVPGPYNNNSRIPELEKRVHRIHGPLEYIGYMVHWNRDYSIILRSLVAPSRGAGGLTDDLMVFSGESSSID